MKHRLVFGTIFTAISNGWIILVSLLLTPFLIHNLGKESYGIWILITSFTATSGFLSLLDLGIQSSIVKFVAEIEAKHETESMSQIISLGLYIFLLMGVIGAIGTTLFAWLFFTRIFSIPVELISTAQLLLIILAVQTFFEFPSLIFLAVLEGLQRFVLLRILIILQMSVYAILVIVLFYLGFGIFSPAIAMFVASVGKNLITMVYALRFLPGLRLVRHFDRALIRRVVGFSGSMFLIRILATIYEQMDKIIIGIVLTSTLLTDYDIANKIRMLGLFAITLISRLMVAPASYLHAAKEKERLQQLFLKGTKYSLAIVFPVAISAMILSHSIIQVWIGSGYTYNTSIAQLFVFYPMMTAFLSVGQNIMLGMGNVRFIIWIMFISISINLVCSIILASRIGVAGVIWGTIIGTVIVFFPYLWYYLKTLEIPLNRFLREVIIPTYPVALVFGLVLFLAHRLVHTDTLLTLALFGTAGMCLYSGMFILFGLSSDERKDLFHTILLRRS